MVVPEDGTVLRKWRITNRRFSQLKAAFVLTGVFLLVGLVSMISLAVMYGKLKEYKQYNARLLDATSKLKGIATRLEKYEERERKLRKIIGSDFQLPTAMQTDQVTSESRQTAQLGDRNSDELGRMITRQEDRMRLVPSIWPVNAWSISKGFVNTGNARTDHYGIDLLAPKKTSVFAAADGKITFSGFDSEYGLMIVIDHGDNYWVTKYGHNGSLLVKEGDFVKKGQAIAVYGGSDGNTTGAHLHYGMFYKGKPENPLDHLPEKPGVKIAQQLNTK